MSIFPSTDIVTDVARAADPGKLNVAMKRLTDLSPSRTAAAREIAAFGEVAQAHGANLSAHVSLSPENLAVAQRPRQQLAPEAAVAQKFEAYILQTWIETLLPKEEGGSFGGGGAGTIWRSMMAEQLGVQLANAGGVGLHKMFDKTHELTAASRDISTAGA